MSSPTITDEEAEKVIKPIRTFLARHAIPFRCNWGVGSPCDLIVEAAVAEKVHLIVMGTHGHGLVAVLHGQHGPARGGQVRCSGAARQVTCRRDHPMDIFNAGMEPFFGKQLARREVELRQLIHSSTDAMHDADAVGARGVADFKDAKGTR